jgi:thiamine-monophosphate kinase
VTRPKTEQTLADLGEKRFVADLLPALPVHPRFLNGFGDDCSVIKIGPRSAAFMKIDRAATPMAAKRGWVDFRMWGRLAVTSSCSDVLAGGGTPTAMMVGLILPRDWSAQDAKDVVLGCAEECAAHDVAFVGGDTKEGPSAEVVGTVLGLGEAAEMVTRRGANPGDVVVLAGSLGGFLGALLVLEEDATVGLDEELLTHISHPVARWSEAEVVRAARAASSAMDTSDGLYDAVATLSADYGAEIELSRLPYHRYAQACSVRFDIPLVNLALGVGDWNIVYTMPADAWQELQREVVGTRTDVELTEIGRISEQPGIRWRAADGVYGMDPKVNEHFVRRQEDGADRMEQLRQSPLWPIASD